MGFQFLDKIETMADVLKACSFTFSLIPWMPVPYQVTGKDTVEDLSIRFRNKEIGGYCGLSSQYFNMLMKHFKVPCQKFNHGLPGYKISHMTNVVTVENNQYVIDPYLNRWFTDNKGNFIPYEHLIFMIQERKLSEIKTVYGPGVKPMFWGNSWRNMTPQSFADVVMASFDKVDYNNVMKKIFGDTDIKLLMLLKVHSSLTEENFKI
jgi:hypothetical protein